ncbi:SDR family NAD(P)-dependent oxidoreductase [Natrinema salsiterrestre]|uniref:SDR family NAD(P)-dependent oxidoreductase n=1 Tax=Natrinema salsiterrestre TaxID=2950540 RepID=A0A9Q4L8G6_9EURY|nr:SDR family NAD(P)-dependent oxidoreductase [Natrinema salsiterrestre]MDF9748482.1 SDR family NAD(P)-dependent oxidoreductase [Natrinema salsiterrestre]
MKLQNTTMLVTGTTGNTGPYMTDQFVDSGANVIGSHITETARNAVENRAEHVDAVSYYQIDLTDQAAVETFTETVVNDHGLRHQP